MIGLLLVGALVLYIVLRHRRQVRGDQSSDSLQAPVVREVSGLEASSYHVPTLKGEAGFYVRSLISSNDEPLTEYVLAMHRIRMIRARILGHKTRGWAIQYWTSASHVLKVHVTSVLSAFQLGFF